MKTLFCLMSISLLQVSCSLFCTCGCGDEFPKKFTVDTVEFDAVDNNFNSIGTQTAAIDNLLFLFTYTKVTFAQIEHVASPITPLYACSPAPPEATQSINQILITSKNNFLGVSQNILAGQSLTGLFQIVSNNGVMDVGDFLAQSNRKLPENQLMFLLKESVVSSQTHTFVFNVTLSGGRVLVGETTLSLI